MQFPVQVALAQLVPKLPTGPGWWYEIKLDGHRTILWRTTEGVRLQARSGRDVTASWMDIPSQEWILSRWSGCGVTWGEVDSLSSWHSFSGLWLCGGAHGADWEKTRQTVKAKLSSHQRLPMIHIVHIPFAETAVLNLPPQQGG
ncbi:hypothetical protein [Streptomyces sp. NPDC001635]